MGRREDQTIVVNGTIQAETGTRAGFLLRLVVPFTEAKSVPSEEIRKAVASHGTECEFHFRFYANKRVRVVETSI